MKTIKIYILALSLSLCCAMQPAELRAQEATVSFQVFYDALSPHGHWVNHPVRGYVWVPTVTTGFVPYSTGGHWIWTDYGWTWVSDYDWGWAPFHYGRWDYEDAYGWYWVPDTEWGPAWVSWRHSPGYYGWAPLAPGIGISVAIGAYNPPPERWIFVQDRYITSPYIYRHYAPRTSYVTIIRGSTVITNTYVDRGRHITYVAGPRRDEVVKVVGRPVRVVKITESDHPVQSYQNHRLTVYRPRVGSTGSTTPRPARVENINEVRQPRAGSGGTTTNTPRGGSSGAPLNATPRRGRVSQPAPAGNTTTTPAPAPRPGRANRANINGNGGSRPAPRRQEVFPNAGQNPAPANRNNTPAPAPRRRMDRTMPNYTPAPRPERPRNQGGGNRMNNAPRQMPSNPAPMNAPRGGEGHRGRGR